MSEIAILIAQLLIKYGPDVAKGFVNAFHHPETITLEMWNKLLDSAESSADKLLTDLNKQKVALTVGPVVVQ